MYYLLIKCRDLLKCILMYNILVDWDTGRNILLKDLIMQYI